MKSGRLTEQDIARGWARYDLCMAVFEPFATYNVASREVTTAILIVACDRNYTRSALKAASKAEGIDITSPGFKAAMSEAYENADYQMGQSPEAKRIYNFRQKLNRVLKAHALYDDIMQRALDSCRHKRYLCGAVMMHLCYYKIPGTERLYFALRHAFPRYDLDMNWRMRYGEAPIFGLTPSRGTSARH